VSDKFAGQTGPCPKCKSPIQIPKAASAEVVIHGPESGGPKNAKGRPVFKPIRRLNVSIPTNAWLIGLGATLLVVFVTWLLGPRFHDRLALRIMGLLVITPPLAVAGYFFFRDREKLDVFSGRELWLRTAICAGAYLLLWAGFAYVRERYGIPQQVWQLAAVLPSMLLLGALAALGCYDLDFSSAVLHYLFHLFVVLALCYVAGMDYLWPKIA